MSSGKRPIPGKKKKAKKKAEFPWVPVLAGVIGMVIALSLMGGGYYVWSQRQHIAGYDSSIAKISEALRKHDPEVTPEGLKPSDIEPLIEGKPEFKRETKDGVDYMVYTWRGGSSPVGIRLKIEKNGAMEEVVEMSTLGLD
ncbi:MAG: hypothetical protein DWH81_15400 [Planctomycetota bacterium]|jgi:hypothetical protein|nr:MAG: hypothetical protein DWH81_15400 [Planctomycetota bacterium]